jgi:hypothetical protein
MEEEERVTGSIDELLRQIEVDEAQDQATVQTKMPINTYAKARGIAPQKVHYHIRARHIQKETCACGRFVIDIAAADEVLGFNKGKGTELEAKYAEDEEGEVENAEEGMDAG